MALQKLQFRPGVLRDVTGYTNEGGWRDSNLVRFRLGFPESVGGWEKYASAYSFLGTCRSMLNWVALDGSNYLAFGTQIKYYVELGGYNYDITPIRSTVVLSGPFAATTGSPIITVTDAAHGCLTGDYVTFSGAVSLGGNITAAVLNKEYSVTVTGPDAYTITAPVNANASDVGNGGATVTAAYQINIGLNTQVIGNGWGAGVWSRGTWGSASTSTITASLRLWSQDNYGEDLIFNIRNGDVYYWDASTANIVPLTSAQRGVTLSSLSTDPETPTIASQIIISDRDRHVIAFGANMGGVTAQDPLSIRYSSQEDPFTWTALPTNTAGELRIGSGTHITRAVETKREILVFTDVAVYSMQFIGPPDTFGIQQVASGVTVNGYNSLVAVDDSVYWMGINTFYVYSGQTQELVCPLLNYVFNNFNKGESDKVFAGLNSEFNEVTWFYPSADSSENDLYVTYNYVERVWTHGSLARTGWIDRGTRNYPIAASTDNYLYYHEVGTDDGSTSPPSAINAYIESAPIDIGDGDKFSFVRRIIPDVSFYNGTNSPTVDFTMKTQNYPGSNYQDGSDSSVIRTSTVPVDQYTNVLDVRLRGRSIILRVESNKVGTRWGLGSPRIETQVDGRR
jgi:hypothetical protein